MRLPKRIAYFVFTIAVLLAAGIYFLTGVEITSTVFDSYQDVISNPERLNAGWLPRWLPKSAFRIKESHDIDTNESWLTFSFSKSDDFYSSVCKPIKNEEVELPRDRNIKQFPEFVSIMNKQLHNNSSLAFYICVGLGPRHLAIDTRSSVAYVWGLAH